MYWFHVTPAGQSPFGPADENSIIAMIRGGQLRGAHICASGQQQWVPIDTYAPFAQALAASVGVIDAPPGTSPFVTRVPVVAPVVVKKSGNGLKIAAIVVVVLALVAGGAFRAFKKRYVHVPAPAPTGRVDKQEFSGPDQEHLVIDVYGGLGSRLSIPSNVDCSQIEGSGSYLSEKEKSRYTCDVGKFPYGTESKLDLRVENNDGVMLPLPVTFTRKREVRVSVWGNDTYGETAKITITGANKGEGSMYGLRLRLTGVTAGTVVTWLGHKGTTDAKGELVVEGDPTTVFRNVQIDALYQDPPVAVAEVKVPIVFDFADKLHAQETVTVKKEHLRRYVTDHVETIEAGAALFPGETAGPGPERRALISEGVFYGHAATFGEIDMVGTVKSRNRSHSCGKYVSSTTGETSTAHVYSVVVTATVYERRTGAKLGEKSFEGRTPRCIRETSSLDLGTGDPPDGKVMVAWFRAFVK